MKIRKICMRFVAMLLAVVFFTMLDWLVHQTSPLLAVPLWYFRNKIIFGTVYAFIVSLVFRKQSILLQSALITIITAGLLQLRYIYYGYPLEFHLIIFPSHLILLYITSFVSLKIFSKWI